MDIEVIAQKIDALEDVMMELDYDPEKREQAWKWLRNIRDDITSFLNEHNYES